MMKRTMTASEKAQRLLKRTMQNGISTKKLLLLGGVALLVILGITMSGSTSGRRRLPTKSDTDEKHNAGDKRQLTPEEVEELMRQLTKEEVAELKRMTYKPQRDLLKRQFPEYYSEDALKELQADITKFEEKVEHALILENVKPKYKVGTTVKLKETYCAYKKDRYYVVSRANVNKRDKFIKTYRLMLHPAIVNAFNAKLDGITKDGVAPFCFPHEKRYEDRVPEQAIDMLVSENEEDFKTTGEKMFSFEKEQARRRNIVRRKAAEAENARITQHNKLEAEKKKAADEAEQAKRREWVANDKARRRKQAKIDAQMEKFKKMRDIAKNRNKPINATSRRMRLKESAFEQKFGTMFKLKSRIVSHAVSALWWNARQEEKDRSYTLTIPEEIVNAFGKDNKSQLLLKKFEKEALAFPDALRSFSVPETDVEVADPAKCDVAVAAFYALAMEGSRLK